MSICEWIKSLITFCLASQFVPIKGKLFILGSTCHTVSLHMCLCSWCLPFLIGFSLWDKTPPLHGSHGWPTPQCPTGIPIKHYLHCIAAPRKMKPCHSWCTLAVDFHTPFLVCSSGQFTILPFLTPLSIHPLPSGFCSRPFFFFLNILPLPDVLFHPLGCKSLNWPFLNLFTDLSLEFLIHIITHHTSFTHMFQRHQKFNMIRIALSIFLPYQIYLLQLPLSLVFHWSGPCSNMTLIPLILSLSVKTLFFSANLSKVLGKLIDILIGRTM